MAMLSKISQTQEKKKFLACGKSRFKKRRPQSRRETFWEKEGEQLDGNWEDGALRGEDGQST